MKRGAAIAIAVAALFAAGEVRACSVRRPADMEAHWADARSKVEVMFIGQVLAKARFSAAERRSRQRQVIAGVFYGPNTGEMTIGPVESLQGQAEPVISLYSDGSFCGHPFNNPSIGDIVLVTIETDGFPSVFTPENLEDPVLRTLIEDYWDERDPEP